MTRFIFPVHWRIFVSLLLLEWVASFTHEFTHHLTALLVCGEGGRMSLDRFVLTGPCDGWPYVALVGPLLSYMVMWMGTGLVLQGRRPLFGLALVAAYVPFLRLLIAAMGRGDESLMMTLWLPAPAARLAAVAVVLVLILMPLSVCWRALANRRRTAVFFAAFLVPILPALVLPTLDAIWYGQWLGWSETPPNFLGVPWSAWGVQAVMAALCALALWRWRDPGLLDAMPTSEHP